MSSSKSTTHRASERFSYVPRDTVTIEESTGIYVLDRYLEYDCLLTRPELRRLRDHKYSAIDTSWLDEFCMKTFWEWIVKFFPLWLAPNVITLIGLIINLFTVLFLSYYSPTATEAAPRWVYFLAAIGLFIYQTLDAIDGKQARRTKSASPLGELFDHGCDSVSQVFVALNCCYALRLGEMGGVVFSVAVMAICLFYCAHWGTYCTGQLRFSKYDVTEAQVTIIFGLLATAIFGPDFWKIRIIGAELRQIALFVVVLGFLYQMYQYGTIVFTGGVGKNGSTVAGTSILSPLSPLLSVILPFYIIYSGDKTTLYVEHISLFIICMGAVSSKATNRLVVAHMCRGEIFVWDWIYLAPIFLMLNHYYVYPCDPYYLLCFVTLYAYLSLFIYCFYLTRQICNYLGIRCFQIPIEEINAKNEPHLQVFGNLDQEDWSSRHQCLGYLTVTQHLGPAV